MALFHVMVQAPERGEQLWGGCALSSVLDPIHGCIVVTLIFFLIHLILWRQRITLGAEKMTWVLILWCLVDPGIKLRLSDLMGGKHLYSLHCILVPNMLYLFFPRYFILCVWACCLSVHMYVYTCVVHRGQKKALELRMTVSHPVSAGNQTQVLCKSKCS